MLERLRQHLPPPVVSAFGIDNLVNNAIWGLIWLAVSIAVPAAVGAVARWPLPSLIALGLAVFLLLVAAGIALRQRRLLGHSAVAQPPVSPAPASAEPSPPVEQRQFVSIADQDLTKAWDGLTSAQVDEQFNAQLRHKWVIVSGVVVDIRDERGLRAWIRFEPAAKFWLQLRLSFRRDQSSRVLQIKQKDKIQAIGRIDSYQLYGLGGRMLMLDECELVETIQAGAG